MNLGLISSSIKRDYTARLKLLECFEGLTRGMPDQWMYVQQVQITRENAKKLSKLYLKISSNSHFAPM